MIDDVKDIIEMYDSNPGYEHQRLERHQLEHDITWYFLEKYLPKEASILEIGSATGRYTVELTKRGYNITAVDFSIGQIEECRKNLAREGLLERVLSVHADARDLSKIEKKDFDVVLMMGPLYHLVIEEDRNRALKEAYSHLKSGGTVVSAFISRFGILGHLIKNSPGWIKEQSEVRSIIDFGRDPEEMQKGGFRGYFATASEIVPLHEDMGFETLTLAGVEPAISADDESYNRLEGEERKLWLKLLCEISTEESIIGSSRHLLYVGRKK